MKFSVKWHKEGLANMHASLERKREEIKRAQESFDSLQQQCVALDAQIIEAEIRGLDGFDSERFGIKRSK